MKMKSIPIVYRHCCPEHTPASRLWTSLEAVPSQEGSKEIAKPVMIAWFFGSLLLLISLLGLSSPLYSQEDVQDSLSMPRERLPFSIGAVAGYNLHLYFGSVDLGSDPSFGAGNCGVLSSGIGTGVTPGVLAEYKLPSGFRLGARFMFDKSSGKMSEPTPGGVGYRMPNDSVVPIESEQRFNVDITSFTVELYVDEVFRTSWSPSLPMAASRQAMSLG